MNSCFVTGALAHLPLLHAVLGLGPTGSAGFVENFRLVQAARGSASVLVENGPGVAGVVLFGLRGEQLSRLHFYHARFRAAPRDVNVRLSDGRTIIATTFLFDGKTPTPPVPWVLEDWLSEWSEAVVAAELDIMQHYPEMTPEQVQGRYGQFLARAGGTIRARQTREGLETLRRKAGTVSLFGKKHPYIAYFSIEEFDLQHERFDGKMSPTLNRAVFISGDAAILLPYDPVRDRVLVIQQFRAGPYARGDANPWLVEAIAGRVDGGETPEMAARREAQEEAGLTLQALVAGPSYYPSPAAKAEYLYSFVGIADLPDEAAGLGGLESEAEDIRSHVIDFEHLMRLAGSGEIDNAPLLILAHWLASQREALRHAYARPL